jgi:GNAT acetyltransferase-like protein
VELHSPTPPLSDRIVTLRELTAADVAAVTVACRDPEIVRWTTEIPENYTEEDARQWIESTLAGWKRGNAGWVEEWRPRRCRRTAITSPPTSTP